MESRCRQRETSSDVNNIGRGCGILHPSEKEREFAAQLLGRAVHERCDPVVDLSVGERHAAVEGRRG